MKSVFEIYQDRSGEWRFRLKAKNGEIIATGEGYKTKQGCIRGVESVKRNAAKAIVMTETELISGEPLTFKDKILSFFNDMKSKFKNEA